MKNNLIKFFAHGHNVMDMLVNMDHVSAIVSVTKPDIDTMDVEEGIRIFWATNGKYNGDLSTTFYGYSLSNTEPKL